MPRSVLFKDEADLGRYVESSRLYLRNSEEMVRRGELAKAGELLWGAVAELLKATGLLHNRPVSSHRELIELGKHIAVTTGDPDLKEGIVNSARALHANFYEGFIDEGEFHAYYGAALDAYGKLYNMVMVTGTWRS